MKRIVNGVTYNTDTSTILAGSRWEDDDGKVVGRLYQTRGGAFFVDEETTGEVWIEDMRQSEIVVRHSFRPLSPEQANKWLMEGDVEIFQNPFDDPPEATAEAEPGATIYIRVPASLKKRVDERAGAAKVSGNVWAMRCLEQCSQTKTIRDFRHLFFIWSIAGELRSAWASDHVGEDANLDQWKLRRAIQALDQIADFSNELAELLGLDGADLADGCAIFQGNSEYEGVRKGFAPYPEGDLSGQ